VRAEKCWRTTESITMGTPSKDEDTGKQRPQSERRVCAPARVNRGSIQGGRCGGAMEAGGTDSPLNRKTTEWTKPQVGNLFGRKKKKCAPKDGKCRQRRGRARDGLRKVPNHGIAERQEPQKKRAKKRGGLWSGHHKERGHRPRHKRTGKKKKKRRKSRCREKTGRKLCQDKPRPKKHAKPHQLDPCIKRTRDHLRLRR